MRTPFRTPILPTLCGVLLCAIAAHQPLVAADPPRAVKKRPDPYGPSGELKELPDKFTPGDVAKPPFIQEEPPKVVRPKVSAPKNDGLSPEERVRRELAKPTKVEFIETPLREVMQFISEQHGLEIQFDESALKEAGLGSDTAIPNVNLNSNSLSSAFQLILRPLKLTHVISSDGVLLVTTQEAANTMLTAKVFPVQDLIATKDDLGENVLAYDDLIGTLVNALQPSGWDTNGGPGTIRGVQGTLAVNQTQELHAKIATLLAAIRTAKQNQLKTPGGPAILATGTAEQQAAYRKLKDLLEKPGRLEFIETPLREVMQSITDNDHIPIIFDEAALKEAGLGSDSAVPNINLKDLPVRAILQLILRPLKLAYVIQNEVVVVTTQEAANTMLEARVYPVGDLMAWKTPLADDSATDDLTNSLPLPSAIGPQTWDKVGGSGTIRYYAPAQALVISQTQETHAEIERLLEQLRTDHREHPPAAQSAAVPFEDKPLTRTFALKTTVLSAAEIVNLVQKAQPKSWTAEGAFLQPLERVEIIGMAGRLNQKVVHGSLIARHKPAALREFRRLLREMDVWPKSPPDPSDSPITFMEPSKDTSAKTTALSETMPAPAKCDGKDGVCPVEPMKPGSPITKGGEPPAK